MFEPARADDPGRSQQLADLRARIRRLERPSAALAATLPSSARSTAPGRPIADDPIAVVERALPGGRLRPGGMYSVCGSTSLAMALLSGPTARDQWCAVVGMPDFGVERAGEHGVDLDRLVLVPEPGPQWLTVLGALAEAMTAILVRPPAQPAPGALQRLQARLRRQECALVVAGELPGSDAVLSVVDRDWTGLGAGHGHLAEHRATVQVEYAGRAPKRWHQVISPVSEVPVTVIGSSVADSDDGRVALGTVGDQSSATAAPTAWGATA